MRKLSASRTAGTSAAKTALSLLLCTCAAFTTLAQAQQMYRWVDQNGRVTYSQNPPPAGAAKSVQQRRITGGGGGDAGLPYATTVAAQNFPVTIYTAPDCNDACKSGRDMLTKRGVPFKEVVAADDQSIESLRKLSGATRVPVLQVGRQALSGFEPNSWKSALDDAGYPASLPSFARPAGKASVQRNLPQVKLYANASCGLPCQSARELLATRKVPFQEVMVDTEEGLEEIKKVAGAAGVLPVLTIGGSQLSGFSPDRYNLALDNAGFEQPAATKK